jgi:alpha-tubulin suppressor-like RCC1 family protein
MAAGLVTIISCGGGGGGGDTTPPTVSSNIPANGASDIPVGDALSVTFSEAMNASTITTTSFTLVDADSNAVSGALSYNAGTNTATFTPAVTLATNTTFTATVMTAVTDVAGNALAANYSWSFTTVFIDITPPTVSSTNPASDAIDVAVGITPSAAFDEAMDAATITTASFTLVDAGVNPVSGAVSYNAGTNTATFTPTAALAANTTYTATITPAVTDVAGVALIVDYSWSFTTVLPEAIPPEVNTTNPLKRARGALLSGPITATFSEALDPVTVNVGSFVVTDPVGAVSGTVNLSPDGLTASFTPQTPFNFKTRYDIQLTTAIRDLAGNQLAVDYTWHFNTGKRLAAGRTHVCARLDDGGLKCWGQGSDGQLGLGDAATRGDEADEMGVNLPRVNLGSGRKVLQVVAGAFHTCARLDNATVKCWGGGGVLGLGDSVTRGTSPSTMGDNLPTVNLGSSRTALELVAGASHTCARLDNNNVKCWGNNAQGQLGQGDTLTRGNNPNEMGGNLLKVDLGTDRKARELITGLQHTCARLDDSSVKCWGHNNFGQLGLGDIDNRGDGPNEMGDALLAINFGNGRTVVGIESNGDHSCARLDNNTVKCWGYNNAGQLGQGDTNNRGDDPNEMGDSLLVVDLGSGRTALGLAIGFYHSCARLDDESLKCWGFNGSGELGQDDVVQRGDQAGEMGDNLDAVNLGTSRTVQEVVAKFHHTCARLDDSSVKCWGSNAQGQLGQGDTNNLGDGPSEMGDNLLAVDIGN